MIRLANEQDINAINNLGLFLNDNFSKTYNLIDYIKNDNYIIIVNHENIINGFIIVYKNMDYYELEAISVDINSRKNGIASRLIEFFISNYTNNGDSILLEVAVNNDAAVNLYRKFGFKIINIRKKYYNQIDAYVMKKVI